MQNPKTVPADPLVSGALDRWEEQGLAGDPWAFMAMCSVNRFHQILAKALDTELKPFRIGRTGYFLLTTLALIAGRSARLSTLSRMVMVHPTTVKLTIDQLEAEGLVVRKPHPRDRRTTLVELTDAGLERARAANEALSDPDGRSPLGALSPMHEELFAALQPVRRAAGDVAL